MTKRVEHSGGVRAEGGGGLHLAAKAAGVVLTLAYPLAVFFALTHLSARMVGLAGLCVAVPLLAVRYRNADRAHLLAVLRIPLVVIALLLLSAVLDDARFVMALPVLINVALLITFAGSLRSEMPIVERFARMRKQDLGPAQLRHCRQVTIAWCVFFVVNGAIAAVLALLEWKVVWAVYTGGIAYALMGLMFAGEYVPRIARFGAAR